MNKIFHYLDKKTKFYTIIGALANGGLALAQPLVVSQALSLNQGELTYSKIIQFAVFGFDFQTQAHGNFVTIEGYVCRQQ